MSLPTTKLLVGDVRTRLAELADESVHCVVTSPPYFGLRSYGTPPQIWGGDPSCEHQWRERGRAHHPGQVPDGKAVHPENAIGQNAGSGQFCARCGAWRGDLGLEPTPDLYIEHLVGIFREVRRVLRSDGTLFLNIGDSYASTGGHSAQGKSSARVGRANIDAQNAVCGFAGNRAGIKPKDLIGIPWMLAFALRADGWWLRQDIIWCLSGGTRVYARTQKGEMPTMIKDLVRLDPATVQLWNGEKWTQVLGWSQTPRPAKTYEIELRSGERIGCTTGHEWPVEPCGNIRSDELKVGDVIRRCQLPEPEIPRMPQALNDAEIGWLVGTFLADGSWSHDRTAFTIASNSNEVERFSRLRQIAEQYDGSFRIAWVEGNSTSAIVHSRILAAIIQTYLSGENADGKHLNVRCWRRSNAFLHHLLLGYLQGDGHHDQSNRRWRIGFAQNDALAADLRTVCGRLGYQLRLKRYDHQSQWGIFPGWRGEIRFERSDHHNARDDGEIVAIRESRARKFWDIGVADEPNLFALASGVLTHNSKPNSMPESVTDRCTKAHEYLFLLSKSSQYFYDADAVKEEGSGRIAGNRIPTTPRRLGVEHAAEGHGIFAAQQLPSIDRNKRSVWTIATTPFPEGHFATFPAALVEPCILAGCPEGGTVLDPFFGSGTTGQVAQRLWRSCIGIDLSSEYAKIAQKRMPDGLLYHLEIC